MMIVRIEKAIHPKATIAFKMCACLPNPVRVLFGHLCCYFSLARHKLLLEMITYGGNSIAHKPEDPNHPKTNHLAVKRRETPSCAAFEGVALANVQ